MHFALQILHDSESLVRASQQTSGSDSGPLPKKSNSLPTERDLGRKTQKSSKRSSDGSEQKALPNKRMQGSQTPSSASSSNATSPEGKRSRERRRLHDEDTDRDQSADRGRSGTKSPSKSPKRKQHDQMKGHIKSLSSGGKCSQTFKFLTPFRISTTFESKNVAFAFRLRCRGTTVGCFSTRDNPIT